ncbi:MAG: hypothetical protein ACLTYN_15180 [Dysosmobacter welbionis]
MVLGRCLFERPSCSLAGLPSQGRRQSHDETDRALGMIFYGVREPKRRRRLRQGRDGEAA